MVSGNVSASESGVYVLGVSSLVFIATTADFPIYEVSVSGVALQQARIALDPSSGMLSAIATPSDVYQVHIFIHTHPFIHPSIQTHMHTCIHTNIHTYIHTYRYNYVVWTTTVGCVVWTTAEKDCGVELLQ